MREISDAELAGVTGAGACTNWEYFLIGACEVKCEVLHPAPGFLEACRDDCHEDANCDW
jgi:hypothetical protein